MLPRKTLLALMLTLVPVLHAMDDRGATDKYCAASPHPSEEPLFCIENKTKWPLEIICANKVGQTVGPRYLEQGALAPIPYESIEHITTIAPVSTYGVAGGYANGLTSAVGAYALRWGGFASAAKSTKRYYMVPKTVNPQFLQNMFEDLKQKLLANTATMVCMRVFQQYDQATQEKYLSISCDETPLNKTDAPLSPAMKDDVKITIFPQSDPAEVAAREQLLAFKQQATQVKETLAVKLTHARMMAEIADKVQDAGRKYWMLSQSLLMCCEILRIENGTFNEKVIRACADDDYIDLQWEGWQKLITIIYQSAQDHSAVITLEDKQELVATIRDIIRAIQDAATLVESIVYKHHVLLQLPVQTTLDENE